MVIQAGTYSYANEGVIANCRKNNVQMHWILPVSEASLSDADREIPTHGSTDNARNSVNPNPLVNG